MPSLRTQLVKIPKVVKDRVFQRDNGLCVLCGRYVGIDYANAHIVPRSSGGLGIERNIITLCFACHRDFDQSPKRKELYVRIEKYILRHYPDWKREDNIFKKGHNDR